MADTPNNADDAKGRLKEGVGSITGDDDLKNEGKIDQGAGAVKEGVDKVKDAITPGDDKD